MKKALVLIIILGLCLLAAGGCTPPQAGASSVWQHAPPAGGAPVDVTGLNADNYPMVDGSTANLPLMARVYATLCGVAVEEAETLVNASRTSAAWERLAGGEADLLLVYEAPEETKRLLDEQGAELEVHPIGMDALVFLTNAENPVDSLTQQQLRDIYTGKAANWKQVGGADAPIAAYQRNAESGSQTLFLKLLMGNVAPADPPSEKISMGMGALIDVLSTFTGDEAAIGYSVYFYASEMYQNPQLKFLAVDGVMPTAATLADGSYPLANPFYVAIRANEPAGSPARLLRDWILSEEGAGAVEQAGYVPYQG